MIGISSCLIAYCFVACCPDVTKGDNEDPLLENYKTNHVGTEDYEKFGAHLLKSGVLQNPKRIEQLAKGGDAV